MRFLKTENMSVQCVRTHKLLLEIVKMMKM